MAAPTFVSYTATAFSFHPSQGAQATASISVQNGDILVAVSGTSDSQVSTTSVSGGSLTWTQQQVISVASDCFASVWTTTATSSTSFTVTFTPSGTNGSVDFGGAVYVFRNASVGASNKANTTGSGAPSVNLTTTQANSAIVVFNADFTAVDGTTRTWRSNAGTLTEKTYFRDATQYTVYSGYHADSGSVGTYACGLTVPSTQAYAIIALEVKGSGPTQDQLWPAMQQLSAMGGMIGRRIL